MQLLEGESAWAGLGTETQRALESQYYHVHTMRRGQADSRHTAAGLRREDVGSRCLTDLMRDEGSEGRL